MVKITKDQRKCVVVNPYIFLRGQDIDKDIVKIFENSKWANIDNIDIPVNIDKEQKRLKKSRISRLNEILRCKLLHLKYRI